MAHRTNQGHVESAFRFLKGAFEDIGVDASGFTLHQGSKISGVSNHLIDNRTGSQVIPGYVMGETKRDAYNAMKAATEALDFARRYRQPGRDW